MPHFNGVVNAGSTKFQGSTRIAWRFEPMVITISRRAKGNVEISNRLLHGERGLTGPPVPMQDLICAVLTARDATQAFKSGGPFYCFQNRM